MDIEINMQDVRLIMGERFEENFRRAVHSVYCPGCQQSYRATIVIGRIWLNHLGDITLEGKCKDCGHPVQRYIETGAAADSYEQAMIIRELQIEVLRNYRPRFK